MKKTVCFGFVIFTAFAGPSHAQGRDDLINLMQAEESAIRNDPMLEQFQEQQKALNAESSAEGSWPDPVLKLGFLGLPAQSQRFDEIDMTQQIVGLSQKLPPWGLVAQKRKVLLDQSEAAKWRAEDRALKVVMGVRLVWLELYYFKNGLMLVNDNRKVFQQLVKVTEFQYRAGRNQQHDVMRARVELSLLDDRAAEMEQKFDETLAQLGRYLGALPSAKRLDLDFPTLPKLGELTQLEQGIADHPLILARRSDLKAAEENVKLAQTKYVPSLSLDLTYGEREGDRQDLLSAVVALDLPILPQTRQGKNVAASRAKARAVQDGLEDQHRENREALQREYAAWRSVIERIKHFQQSVMPQAAQNAEASLRAYQNGVTEFTAVARSRLLELDSGLKELRLRVDAAKAQAKILYVSGDKAL